VHQAIKDDQGSYQYKDLNEEKIVLIRRVGQFMSRKSEVGWKTTDLHRRKKK